VKYFNRNLLCIAVLAAMTQHNAIAGSTAMVSVNAQQIVGNGSSNDASLSKGGTAVAFESDAENLAFGDGNNATDVFLKTGGKVVSRISVNNLGQETRNDDSDWWSPDDFADSENPSLSADGKLVVFQSNADNLDLLTLDSNLDTGNDKETDIFLRDVAKKKTYRLSGIMDGADGLIDTANSKDIFGKALSKIDAPWRVVIEANDASTNPVIAGTLKAGFVAFESEATNLIPGFSMSASNKKNIYLLDLKTKTIELISAVHTAGTNTPSDEAKDNSPATVSSTNPAISPDGRFVAFQSTATNLVSGVTGTSKRDIFLYDRLTFRMYQLSGALEATSATGFSVSTEGNDDSSNPSITGGGKGKSYLIAFESKADNLDSVAADVGDNDSDVFVVEFQPGSSNDPQDDLSKGEIKSVKRISAPHGVDGNVTGEASREITKNAESTAPVIAGISTAYTVAFRSTADNLISDQLGLGLFWNGDTNNKADIYVYDSKTNLMSRANVDSGGEQGAADAAGSAISPDGKAIGFDTADDYLVPFFGDNDKTQVYIRKR